MTRVAGAILAGFSLLGVIGLHLSYHWLFRLYGMGIVPPLTHYIPLPVWVIAYGGVALGLVLVAFADARAELGRAPRLLLGGGDARQFAAELAQRLAIEVRIDEALVLEGLAVYAGATA